MEKTKNFAITLISSGAVSAALSGVLLWLTKSWIAERLKSAIKNEYDQKLESYKISLKSEANVALEQLKSSLAIEVHQRNSTMANLSQRRFEAIEGIYAPLRAFVEAAADYANPGGHRS